MSNCLVFDVHVCLSSEATSFYCSLTSFKTCCLWSTGAKQTFAGLWSLGFVSCFYPQHCHIQSTKRSSFAQATHLGAHQVISYLFQSYGQNDSPCFQSLQGLTFSRSPIQTFLENLNKYYLSKMYGLTRSLKRVARCITYLKLLVFSRTGNRRTSLTNSSRITLPR